ncbi:MAG: glycosyltransferase [Ornithinimicrobium sp.]
MTRITHVIVAIPVRNEEELLSGCLNAVRTAVNTLAMVHPHVHAVVSVALDGCTDGSSRILTDAGVHAVQLRRVGVGRSRDAAAQSGLASLGNPQESRTWLACTDADSLVPSNWLVRQLIWADSGKDMVLGTVEPFGLQDPEILAAWQRRHRLVEGHSHVHGANLGVRASTWRAVGGFGHRTAHEDVTLAAKVRARSASWVATDTIRVRTSGRMSGRAVSGFAEYLSELGEPQ